MEENAATFPQKEFEAVCALEEGDLVAVHGRVRLTLSSPWIALIHIFRFQDIRLFRPKTPKKNDIFLISSLLLSHRSVTEQGKYIGS
jgi:hypothetical protein